MCSIIQNAEYYTNFDVNSNSIKMIERKYPKEIQTITITLLVFKLLKDNPSYGYKLIKDIADITENQLIVEEGYLYPLLTKWTKAGLLRATWHQTRDGHKQKHYEISMAGINYYYQIIESYKMILKYI